MSASEATLNILWLPTKDLRPAVLYLLKNTIAQGIICDIHFIQI